MRSSEGCRSKSTMFLSQSTRASGGNPKEDITSVSETSLLPPTALPIEDMIYRGEGNASIVIAQPHERKVIRFRKSLPGEVSPDGGLARAQREVGFVRDVVSCFLGTYAQIPEIVRCDATDMAKLMDVIRPLRPEKRRHKEVVNTYATRYPDYSFLDSHLTLDETAFQSDSTFSVEIKPKQGYLPKADRRFSRCPYCLHQYAKLRAKDIAARSNYCPFDLFSGVEERMKAAVKQLLRLPQNNLKIFKDCFVVYDQESSPSDLEGVLDEWFRNAPMESRNGRARVDEFCNLVCAALTRPFAQKKLELFAGSRLIPNLLSTNQISTSCIESNTIARVERCLRFVGKDCNFDSNELPKDSVLRRIRDVQQLSYVNADYIYSIYSVFASLLKDDMIYSDLMKLSTTVSTVCAALCKNDEITQKMQTIKEIYFQTHFTGTIAGECNDDLNGNHNAGSECILSANTDRMLVNGDFVSQTEISPNLDSQPSFYGNKRPHNQRANNSEGDERKANTLTIAEHLLALQNYLLFTTARDCSILMTFRELHPESAPQAPIENTIKLSERLYFLSDARVLDLDPKNVHCIEKHRQRDIDIFDSIISLVEENILLKNR